MAVNAASFTVKPLTYTETFSSRCEIKMCEPEKMLKEAKPLICSHLLSFVVVLALRHKVRKLLRFWLNSFFISSECDRVENKKEFSKLSTVIFLDCQPGIFFDAKLFKKMKKQF